MEAALTVLPSDEGYRYLHFGVFTAMIAVIKQKFKPRWRYRPKALSAVQENSNTITCVIIDPNLPVRMNCQKASFNSKMVMKFMSTVGLIVY
jgi:hypothetical protein